MDMSLQLPSANVAKFFPNVAEALVNNHPGLTLWVVNYGCFDSVSRFLTNSVGARRLRSACASRARVHSFYISSLFYFWAAFRNCSKSRRERELHFVYESERYNSKRLIYSSYAQLTETTPTLRNPINL